MTTPLISEIDVSQIKPNKCNLCTDCKYLGRSGYYIECFHPKNTKTDLVLGKTTFEDVPPDLRENDSRCGKGGRWFVQRGWNGEEILSVIVFGGFAICVLIIIKAMF